MRLPFEVFIIIIVYYIFVKSQNFDFMRQKIISFVKSFLNVRFGTIDI